MHLHEIGIKTHGFDDAIGGELVDYTGPARGVIESDEGEFLVVRAFSRRYGYPRERDTRAAELVRVDGAPTGWINPQIESRVNEVKHLLSSGVEDGQHVPRHPIKRIIYEYRAVVYYGQNRREQKVIRGKWHSTEEFAEADAAKLTTEARSRLGLD